MGCTAVSPIQPEIRVIPLQYQRLNSYVDQFPRITLQKLKEKFEAYANENGELAMDQFCLLYSSIIYKSGVTDDIEGDVTKYLSRLFLFFSDMQAGTISFKQFFIKYAIINKCEKETLSDIIYFLHSTFTVMGDPMRQENYQKFVEKERDCFGFEPTPNFGQAITKKQFLQKLTESGFLWNDYRKRFCLIEKEDMPFDDISRQILDMEVEDYIVGEEYYVISSSWFSRWEFFYRGKDHNLEQEDLKSKKLMKKRNSVGEKNNRKRRFKENEQKTFSNNQDNIWLFEQPTEIQFDDIEGQYEGELKENLSVQNQCRFVNLNIWNMLKKVHTSKSEYKRTAISETALQLYPKTVYYLRTNNKGEIIDRSLQILQLPMRTRLQKISSIQKQESYFFVKEFGKKVWLEEQKHRMVAECSAEPRFFIVETTDKTGFLSLHTRKYFEMENITYGDKVFCYFPFAKKIMEAYVLRLPSNKTSKIHFTKFNFRYEIQVEKEHLAIKQDSDMTDSIKITLESETHLFKGLQNIGNTCFMNSIIQSLIATPILDKYLESTDFSEKTQPLLSAISAVGKRLLNNQKTEPDGLKKAIDLHLEVFSGYDQHDAQQFLNLLLDKIGGEMKMKPTIVDELFSGEIKATLTCCFCHKERHVDEKICTLSLPIPEPEYNTFTIIVFPIYEISMKKVVIRLHRDSTFRQYLETFEDRTNKNISDFVFCEVFADSIKKIRLDFQREKQSDEKIINKGISTTSEIYAFEKLRKSFYLEVQDQNRRNHVNSLYVDFYDEKQKTWTLGKLLKKGTAIQKYHIANGFTTAKLPSNQSEVIKPLGQMVREISYRKFHFRKLNSALKKMDVFGYELLVGLPKYFSYAHLQSAISTCLLNYTDNDYMRRSRSKSPYFIKVVDLVKSRCVFCSMPDVKVESSDELQPCCMVIEKDTPLLWVAKEKSYQIFVDWVDMKRYNAETFSSIQVDSLSTNAQKLRTNEKITIEECMQLTQKPEKVEMECEKCHHPLQFRTQIFQNPPNILVLHMKEFKVTSEKMLLKLDVNLKWIQYLDISKYSLNEKGQQLYELYGYVCHTGSNQSGHYTCVTKRKHPFQNRRVWVNFDDEKTQIIEKEQKNIDSAYLLFFKKVDMPMSAQINFIKMSPTK